MNAAAGSSYGPDAALGNFRGLFAGDWATDDKIAFLAETFTVFSSLQRIAAEEEQRQRGVRAAAGNAITSLLPPVQTLQYFHRISGLYRGALRTYIQALEATEGDNDDDDDDDAMDEASKDLEMAQSMHTILHFAEVVYVPGDGRGAGVVGEEILHWLNSFDLGE